MTDVQKIWLNTVLKEIEAEEKSKQRAEETRARVASRGGGRR